MDFSKFKTSDWLKVGGALVFVVFGFMSWISISGPGGLGSSSGANVFDFFWTGTLPWILVIGVGVLTVLHVSGSLKSSTAPWSLIMLGATGLAALLLILRLIINPLSGKDAIEAYGGSVGRGIGMYGSVIGGVAAFVGSLMGFKESGGDLNDLKDINKIKSQFSSTGGGSTPPPPPPPPGMPPPPPPAG